jgi:hypothetical protein
LLATKRHKKHKMSLGYPFRIFLFLFALFVPFCG